MTLSEDDQANIALVVLLPVTTILVSLRAWVKSQKLRSFGYDDGALVFAWVSFAVFGIALYVESRVPEETQRPKGTPPNFRNIRMTLSLTMVSNVFYSVTSLLLKAAIGLFYLRLVTARRVRIMIWTIICISTVNSVMLIFFLIFLCGDPRHFLDNALAGNCLDANSVAVVFYEQAVVNSFTDFAFIVMPIYILWGSMQSRQSKIAIGGILLLGTSGSIFSIIRIPFIERVRHPSSTDSLEAVDLWSTLELGTGIIAACLPSLGSYYKSAFIRIKQTIFRSKLSWRDPDGKWATIKFLTKNRQELTVETAYPKGTLQSFSGG